MAQRDLGFDVDVFDEMKSPLLLGRWPEDSRKKKILDLYGKADSKDSLIEFHFAQTALLTLPVFMSKNTRSIFHFHGPWFLEGQVQGDNSIRVFAKRLVELIVYKNQNLMTTHSNAFKEVLLNEFKISEEKIRVVYPGVNLDKFQIRDKEQARQVFDIPSDQKVLLCIRRLEPRMGIHLAIDAMEHFADCVLIIAGTGSLAENLREYANSKPYRSRIRFLGSVDEEKHALIFNAADVVVVPTLSVEGFGLIVWEAFASGIPVVASRVGGLTEALGDFAADYSFETGSLENLVEKIQFALSNTIPAKKFREAVEDRSWKNTAIAIEEFTHETYGRVH
jgi:glycosyltransferase involved in cell wall biosynthesis